MSTALSIPAQATIEERIKALYNSDPVTAANAIAAGIETYDLKSDDDEKVIIDGLKVVKVAFDLTEEERRKALSPVEHLRDWINGGYAKITGPYKAALESGKERIKAYRAEKARSLAIAQAEQRRLAEVAAAAAKERAGAGLAPPPAAVTVAPVANTTKGGIGSASGTKRMHVRMVDAKVIAEKMPYLLELKGAGPDGWVKGPTQAAVLEVKAALMRNAELGPNDVPGLEWVWDQGISLR
jgi:hypothetical protein